MTSRTANKIKQRRERLKGNQTPVVVSKPNKLWFWLLAAALVIVIIFLSYLAYTSDFTNELIIPIIAAVTVLLLLIIWYLPKFYVRSLPIETGKDFDREKERLKLEDDTRKTFAQIVGGIVFLGGLIFTYNTFRLQQEGQFTDRFTKAIAQLGEKDKLDIRLGGMYALERIAKDSPKDHWTVMEILSAYIRENTKAREETAEKNNTNKPANDKVDRAERNAEVTTDVQAALTIIGRRKIEQDPKTETTLINLGGANLSGANLGGANLSRAHLYKAQLFKVNLFKAHLIEANFTEAILNEATLSEAHLFKAHLFKAHLIEAHLSLANLSEAVLFGADLSKAHLSGTDLRRADLRLVKNLIFEQLSEAIIDENTLLPDDLESRKAELLEISKKNLEVREQGLKKPNKK